MKPNNIKICDFLIYPGRNIYSHRPMMKMVVDIGKYGSIPTKDIEGFNERLLKAFPGLKTNCCGLGYEGGFLERLNTGTYLGHVLEHVILEMQAMIGYDVSYGKTRVIEEPSLYYLVYEYQNEVCGLECGKAAAFILNCFLNGEDLEIGEFIDYFKKISIESELGPSTLAIVEEAKKRGIPITRIGSESLVRLGYGKHSRIIESTLTDATSCIAADISSNKQLTKSILCEHHIPVPYGKVVFSEISAQIAARQIGFPVVLKPFNGNQGKGVFLNINSEEEVIAAFKEASRYSNGIIVENYIPGRDFRILVVDGRVSAAAERHPAMVTGDGVHSIKELVELVNRDENRGESHEKPLTKIKLDSVCISLLEKSGMAPDTVPDKGQAVALRAGGNLSTGGTATDRTDEIHPENAELAVLSAKAIGIDIAGIDIVTDDISKPILETGGAVVEVNTAPGIRMHLFPSHGKPRNVAKDIVDYLFPSEESCRFPIVSVTGTNGKTTTVRMISHSLCEAGKSVGMTNTSGTYINGKCLYKGDHSGPKSAKTLLSSKTIDCAVLETARGGIIKGGLGYDLADVGVVLNIAEDHLGLDGAQTLEDLAYVKSLVTEAVRENGFAVFNGEDKMTPYLMKRTHARKCVFYKNEISADIGRQAEIKVYADSGVIKIDDCGKVFSVIKASEIPITHGGLIECNIENSLAASAALYALGLSAEDIARGLKSFRENFGRFSLYTLGGFKVMLDYGHNLPGYKEAVKACRNLGYGRLVGVVGMPGDRSGDAIRSVGSFCGAQFDRLYVKEDLDRRGRKPGETAALLCDGIGGGKKPEVILNELDALKAAVGGANSGDLIAVFYENPAPLTDFLSSAGASPEII